MNEELKPVKCNYGGEIQYICPNCKTKVGYTEGTGHIFIGGSESYEDWRVIEHEFCPGCGMKLEWE